MIHKKIIIANPSGIHIKPMMDIAKMARKYTSHIEIVKDGVGRNAKDFFDMAEGEFLPGSEVCLKAEGMDEKEAFDEIYNFIINLKD